MAGDDGTTVELTGRVTGSSDYGSKAMEAWKLMQETHKQRRLEREENSNAVDNAQAGSEKHTPTNIAQSQASDSSGNENSSGDGKQKHYQQAGLPIADAGKFTATTEADIEPVGVRFGNTFSKVANALPTDLKMSKEILEATENIIDDQDMTEVELAGIIREGIVRGNQTA